MSKVSTLIAGLVLALFVARPAWGESFAANQLRLADTYLHAGNSIAALVPLLNVLRQPDSGTQAEIQEAKSRLAEAYLNLGLHGSARNLISDLKRGDEPWRSRALKMQVEMHLRRGELQDAFRTLQTYGGQITGPLDDDLLFEVARAAFASRATFVTELNLDRLADDGKRPEALFYAGVERLMAKELAQAYERFDALAKKIDRAKTAGLFDNVHLALGRIFLENNQTEAAARFYTAIPETSEAYDQALYETAWAYLAEGDETAAAGNLLHLAIERPFSPLVPKAQVLYGYLLLRRGEFASAERSFAGYVAHYAALSETIAELNAIPSDARLYKEIFGSVDDSIAAGDDYRIELLTWLQKNPRLARARHLVTTLQAAESELADLAHTLREVQSVAEGGPLAQPVAEQRRREEEERNIRELRSSLQEEVSRLGERFTGQALVTYRNLEKELSEIQALRGELNRLRQRAVEKRRELVSLLQYADAGRLTIWDERGELHSGPATEVTSLSNAEADTMLQRLDESERKTLSALRIVDRLEAKALQARLQLMITQVPKTKLSGLLEKQAELRRLEETRFVREESNQQERLEKARLARKAVHTHVKALSELRNALLAHSSEAVGLRGAVTRTEMRKIEHQIGSLLVHARLGNADVAWEARKRARERAREVMRQEQKDMESLQQFYRSLGKWDPPKPGDSLGLPATSSTAQRASYLYDEAELYADRLAYAEKVLDKQSEASRQLVERLQSEGHEYDMVARVDAAGVLIPEPEPVPGLHLIGVQLMLDGRKVAPAQSGLLLDSYLQPGSHQIDATVMYMDREGELIRFSGSYHFRLDRSRGYKLVLLPEKATEYPHLRFTLSDEAKR
jgi:hypothetical protein